MPQASPYNRSFSFSNLQAQNPTAVPPGSSIDLELNNVNANSDGVLANLARIQRDDGALANGSVSFDPPALQTAGLAPALPWVAGTAYSVNASVTSGSAFYRCLLRKRRMDRKLKKREQDAVVVLTLGTATLIVCFSYVLTLI